MPVYTIRDPQTGRTLTIRGDSPPTEPELEQLFAAPVNVGADASFTVNDKPVLPEGQPSPDPLSPSVMEGWQTKVARGSKALPAVGGAIGGTVGKLLGLPGAVGLAGLGGGLGEAIGQLVRLGVGKGAEPDSLSAAKDIGKAGLEQGAMELGGRGLMAGGRLLGRTLYDAALRPTKTLLEEFPDVVKTALRERLPVNDIIPGVGRKGSQVAARARQDSARNTTRLLDDAGAKGGVRFAIKDVVDKPFRALEDQIMDQPLVRSDLATLGKFARELLTDKSGDLTPLKLKQIKASAQNIAEPIWRARRQGNAITAKQAMTARMNAAVATGAKESLESIGGVAESEAKTRALIGAARAIRQAEARRAPLTTHILSGVAGGGGVMGGAGMGGGAKDDAALGLMMYSLMRVAASPRTMSRAGITLTRDSVQEVLRLLPYAAEGMYQATRPLGTEAGQPSPGQPMPPK